MKRLLAVLVVASMAIALPLAYDADAQSHVLVDAEAAAQATDVVNGTVVATTTVESGRDVTTLSELEISDAVKGSQTGPILIELAGGTRSDGVVIRASHVPVLEVGDTVQVALVATSQDAAQALQAEANAELEIFSVVGGEAGVSAFLPAGVSASMASGDYSLSGQSWPGFSPPINYRINPVGSQLPAPVMVNAVNRGFQRWIDDPLSAVEFNYQGSSSVRGKDLTDGENTVSWINIPPAPGSSTPPLAVAWTAFIPGANILEVDIEINTTYAWSDGAVPGRYDLETIVAHEVGHGLGLNHVHLSSELMYLQVASNTVKPLGSGDRAGVRALYPQPTAGYVGILPSRVLDTRNGHEGAYSTPWGAGQTRTVQVGGLGGVPSSGVDAVAVHVTAVNPTAAGSHLTVWPTGVAKPTTAALIFGSGSATSGLVNDLVISQLGPNGTIDIYNDAGSVDIVVDVVGFFTPASPAGYTGLTPARVLDTRNFIEGAYSTPWSGAMTRTVQVGGLGGVPGSGVHAVAVHVTSVNPSAPGSFLTVWPSGQPRPLAASLNFGTSASTTQVVNNLVIVPLGPGGTIDLFNQAGTVDVVIDVVGYFSSSSADRFVSWTPSRFIDSRIGLGYSSPWWPGETRIFGTTCKALAFNAATVNATAAGSYLTVRPGGEIPPSLAAMHNFGTGASTASLSSALMLAKANSGGQVEVYNNAGSVDLVFDAVGGFGCT